MSDLGDMIGHAVGQAMMRVIIWVAVIALIVGGAFVWWLERFIPVWVLT